MTSYTGCSFSQSFKIGFLEQEKAATKVAAFEVYVSSLVATSATTMSALPAATVATTPAAATRATTATTSTAASTATGTTTAARTISAAIASAGTRRLRSIDTIEVWLIAFFEVSAPLESQSATRNRRGHSHRFRRTSFFPTLAILRRRSATHLCALLFQDGFAREANAIAFNRQHFHQHLIAFFQLVANVFNAMLGDFADV